MDKLDDDSRLYTTRAIDELFLKAEADALVAYLEEHYGEAHAAPIEVTKFEPPFPSNAMFVSRLRARRPISPQGGLKGEKTPLGQTGRQISAHL